MNAKRSAFEILVLVLAAVVCASVANLLAARERRVAFVGSYPDAWKVPPAASEAPPAAAPAPPPAASTSAPAASPAQAATEPAPVSPASTSASPRKESAPKPAAPSAAPAQPAGRVSSADLLTRFPQHKDKPYVEVTREDVKFLHGAGALVLDARRSAVYEDGHIAGARSISVWEADVDERVTALVGEGRDTAQPVVIYCSGGDCEDSHMLAQKLWGAGFENLLVYHDGFPDWQKRGGSVKRGAQP